MDRHGKLKEAKRQQAFPEVYYDADQPVCDGRAVNDFKVITPVTLQHFRPVQITAKPSKSSVNAKFKLKITTYKRPNDGPKAIVVEVSQLHAVTVQRLYDGLAVNGRLFYRPTTNRPMKPVLKTQTLVPRKKQVVNRDQPLYYDPEDGLPVYHEDDDPEVTEQVADILGHICTTEHPEDAVVVDCPDLLQLLPDQCAQVLHLNTYCLTEADLQHVIRILKPSGRVVFLNEGNKDEIQNEEPVN